MHRYWSLGISQFQQSQATSLNMASHQHLIGTYSDTGDTQLVAVGYFVAFKHRQNLVKEKVFVIRGTPKLLLAIPRYSPFGTHS